jgi:hypothetical protein
MRTGIGPLSCSPAKPRSAKLLICAGAFLTSSVALAPSELARAAEFGADPWIKGFTDIYAGILPSVPGLYFRTDAYHYEAFAERTVFNGFVQLGVEQDLTATIMTLTYVTPWKILGGTYAFGVAPAMMAVNVDVGLGLPQFTGPVETRSARSTSRSGTLISLRATPGSFRSCSAGIQATSTGTLRHSPWRRPAITAGSSSLTRA